LAQKGAVPVETLRAATVARVEQARATGLIDAEAAAQQQARAQGQVQAIQPRTGVLAAQHTGSSVDLECIAGGIGQRLIHVGEGQLAAQPERFGRGEQRAPQRFALAALAEDRARAELQIQQQMLHNNWRYGKN
jgi:hypothetical protein